MERFSALSCGDFTRELASGSSTPGGGGAAALCGALAAALCSMAANFTVGRKKYADVEPEMREIIARCEEMRLELLGLIDLDAAAFEPLARAYSIPKDDPSRAYRLNEASAAACEAPLKIMELCGRLAALLSDMGGRCNQNLISDVGCSAILCVAALRAARMNLLVNTAGMTDAAAAGQLERRGEELYGALPLAEGVANGIERRMGVQ